MKSFISFIGIAMLVLLFGLVNGCKHTNQQALFTALTASQSGIHFSNDIHDSDSTFSFINEFGYMGGGVGIGDFNKDGIKDIFFSGNQVSCQLYIGKGNNQFEDISAKAGISTNVWCTGVSIADVNQDGYDDIYVCVFGKDLKHRAKNLLFLNQHNLTFKEAAQDYGLADNGYSTQAAFFDYDKDGDLDMYLANYLLTPGNSNAIYPRDKSGFSQANDKLYRNDGDSNQIGHPHFTDVTFSAGIKEDGYGLGLTINDFNHDGWPDVYVANDFISNDELWQNNHDGTFTNCIANAIQHQSYSSMGVDAADINNDTLSDIITLDMLPESNQRKKTAFSFMNYERYESERAMGYEPSFMRNMLQLNNGVQMRGDTAVPFFSEIGQLSGIQATDWSWSVLMADFNNDGWKDIHITNGIGRDFIDADFLEFSNQLMNSTDGNNDEMRKKIQQKLASLDHVKLPNYLYINNHDLTFQDQSEQAGINQPSMSNGAAYTDLDNDGDLDMVVNNINDPAFVFINNTNQPNQPKTTHSLSIQLKGAPNNVNGFGARVFVYSNGITQLQEQNPVRGYFSSVDQQLLFGLGKADHADSLLVEWPDGKTQRLQNLRADTNLVLSWAQATISAGVGINQAVPVFTEITGSLGLSYQHVDHSFNDYTLQRLLPQKFSQLGPGLAVGDLNKDGTTDFFIGGAFNFSGKLFTQNAAGSFTATTLTDSAKLAEDLDCIFLDVDKDGDNDLLITSGELQFNEQPEYCQPRLYINDSKGKFHLQPNAFPNLVNVVAGCVSAGDFDGDGFPDLFVGGRVSKKYPLPPRSYLLHNKEGRFEDVTATVCPALQNPGMVTSAVWADFNNDQLQDLVIAGEWMPVLFFKNQQGHLVDVTAATGLTQMNGMWRSIIAADVDKDGDMDLVAGNLGKNCEYRASAKEPMQLYASDIDGNGSIDPILFYYIRNSDGERQSYPAIGRGRFADQVPAIKKQFLLNKDYGEATFSDIYKGKSPDQTKTLFCDETSSCFFENIGNGKFSKHILPVEAQFAPINAIICSDINQDGFNDLLLAGNEYEAEVSTGRYDASYGCYLLGNGQKQFKSVSPAASGLMIPGEVKKMALIPTGKGKQILVAAINNGSMRVFKINN